MGILRRLLKKRNDRVMVMDASTDEKIMAFLDEIDWDDRETPETAYDEQATRALYKKEKPDE